MNVGSEVETRQKISLLSGRDVYKPFMYEQAYDFWLAQQQSHWLPSEVQMNSDMQDWKLNMSEAEKSVVGGTLKGFIQTEIVVNDYWTSHVAKWFPHPEIAMMATTFGAFECFDKETELLTATGWKNVTQLAMEDKIAQYDIETKNITFVNPKKVVSYDYKGKLHFYKSATTDICVTPNHDLILIHPTSRKVKKNKSMNGIWGQNYRYPSSGIGCGQSKKLTSFEKLLIVIQADDKFHFQDEKTHKTCDIHLKKKKKIERFESLLEEAKIVSSKREENGYTIFTFALPKTINVKKVKSFELFELQQFSIEKSQAFIEELLFWNGSQNHFWHSTDKNAVDFVQAISTLGSIHAHVECNSKKLMLLQGGQDAENKDNYVVSFSKRTEKTYPYRTEVDYNDKVYCVSVQTQNIISRRNNKVAITGNTIHTIAYAYLNDTLGLLNYDDFLSEPSAKAKIDRLLTVSRKESTKEEIAKSLATFSAFTEGVSLFSSFAILFNFSRFNKLKGIGQIISWSVRDEALHSLAGCWLFREFIKENPEVWTDELKKEIYEAARTTIQIEDAFIDKVFEKGPIEGLDPKDLKVFIRHRANVKLGELGCKMNWKNLDQEALNRMQWFTFLTTGVSQQDFFAGRETAYTKGNQDWGKLVEFLSQGEKNDK